MKWSLRRKVMNDVVGQGNSGSVAVYGIPNHWSVRWRLARSLMPGRHLERFEVRILELLREGQIENPTSTVAFRPISTKQRGACRLLSTRKLVSPIGTLNKTNAEVTLTRKGLYFLQRQKAKAKT